MAVQLSGDVKLFDNRLTLQKYDKRVEKPT